MAEKIDYDNLPESDVIIDHIEKRFKKGLYTLILIYGLPGTGKSSVSTRLAQKTSEKIQGQNEFEEKHIIDSLMQLIDFVRKAKPGQVGVVEEVSVLFPSRRAMSGDNVDVARVLDTCRKKQVILFANAPILSAVDKHIRCLSHIAIETLRINKKEGVVVYKALRMQTNPASGKTYLHRFNRDGREVHRFFTKKPDEKMWGEYEKRKDKFLNDLYDKLKSKAEIKENKELKAMGKKVNVVEEKPLTEKELKVYDLTRNQGLTYAKAAEQLGVSSQRVGAISKNIDKKLRIVPKNEHNNIENKPSLPINLN